MPEGPAFFQATPRLTTVNWGGTDKRAAAVKSWLVQKGSVNGKQIKTKGWGKANAVAPNINPDGSDNPDGRQKNRRVEITVKK